MNENDGVKNENKPEDEVKAVFTDENIDSAVEDSFFDADNKKRGPRNFFSVPASGEDGEAEGEPENPEDESSDFESIMALIKGRTRGKVKPDSKKAGDAGKRLDADDDDADAGASVRTAGDEDDVNLDEEADGDAGEVYFDEDPEDEKPKNWLSELVHAKKGDRLYVLHEIISYILIFAVAFVAAIFINIYIFRISNVVGRSMNQTFHDGQTVFLSRLPYIFGTPKHGDVVIFDSHGDPRTFAKDWNDALKSNALVKLFQKDKTVNEDDHDFYIKRVIGVAGDAIRIHDNKVWRAKISDLGSEYAQVTALYKEYAENPSSEGGQKYIELWQAIANLPLDETVWEALDEPYVNPAETPNYTSWEGRCWIVPEKHMFVMGDNRNHSTDGRYFGIRPYSCILGRVLGNY